MLRISAGEYKNRTLKIPSTARPLLERIRASMFGLIPDFIPEARVLDLYAGSGITGLEALSRGASSCVFVDSSYDACNLIKENILRCQFDSSKDTKVIQLSAARFAKFSDFSKEFDLIFIDPPFDSIKKINITLLLTKIKDDGLLVARLPNGFRKKRSKDLIIDGFEEVYAKSYGNSEVVFYKPKI